MAKAAAKSSGAGKSASTAPIQVTSDGRLAVNTPAVDDSKANDGGPGPDSSLKTGVGSPTGASAGGHNHEGRRGDTATSKGMDYDVQVHTDEKGLEVIRVNAESGDEAAQKALAKKNYRGTSIRGVTPASDPDPNSLGGERDASIMIANGENPGGGVDPLGDEHNREAVKKLGKADVSELGE